MYAVLNRKEGPISMNDINEMTYLEQCIREALRLFPPGPVILRRATDKIILSRLKTSGERKALSFMANDWNVFQRIISSYQQVRIFSSHR